jgi:hypothetical protein
MPFHRLLVAGFLLVLTGAVLPFLMVMGILPASLFLSFVSYLSSVGGLLLGLVGAASWSQFRARQNRPELE